MGFGNDPLLQNTKKKKNHLHRNRGIVHGFEGLVFWLVRGYTFWSTFWSRLCRRSNW